MIPPFDRRSLIRAAGQMALFAGISRHAAMAAPPVDYPFTLGVASGDPWPDGFVIWTRLAPRPFEPGSGMPMGVATLAWEIAGDDRFAQIVQSGETLARPELGHAVHVEVAGLQPARPYWYRFRSGANVSPAGVVRTAPAAGAAVNRLRIGVAGCQHYEQGLYTAYAHLAREPELDAVFHYGDYIYEHKSQRVCRKVDGKPVCVRDHVGDEIYSLDDYRRRYAQYKLDPDLQAAHAAAAFVSTFDDHEVDNNWAAQLDQDGTPPEIFLMRRFAALQAWYENMPVRRAQLPDAQGITAYRRLDYGRLLRMHVLDTRSFRSDQPCNDGKEKPCPPDAHVSATMLGGAQEKWLDDGLGNAAAWNFVAQQVLVMPFDRRKPGAAEPDLATDTWDGYRPARARFIDSIRRHRLSNVVIASGDYHKHFAGTVPVRDDAPEGEMAAVEFLATSISSLGNGKPIPNIDTIYANNPHVKLFADQRGYQLFTITPGLWTTDVKAVDEIEKPGGGIRTVQSFAVTPDRPALQQA